MRLRKSGSKISESEQKIESKQKVIIEEISNRNSRKIGKDEGNCKRWAFISCLNIRENCSLFSLFKVFIANVFNKLSLSLSLSLIFRFIYSIKSQSLFSYLIRDDFEVPWLLNGHPFIIYNNERFKKLEGPKKTVTIT